MTSTGSSPAQHQTGDMGRKLRYMVPLDEDLTPDELHQLATYQAERARGLMHSYEWRLRMAGLQRAFDEQQRPTQQVTFRTGGGDE